MLYEEFQNDLKTELHVMVIWRFAISKFMSTVLEKLVLDIKPDFGIKLLSWFSVRLYRLNIYI